MTAPKKLSRMKKIAAVAAAGTAFQFGSCNLGEFTTTTTTTLDGREVVQFLVRSAIVTPLVDFIDGRIDAFFDDVAGEDED